VRQRIICKKDDYEEDGELPGVKQHGGLLPVNIPEYYIILISAKGTGKRRRASAGFAVMRACGKNRAAFCS
jgi:hypothetical protein